MDRFTAMRAFVRIVERRSFTRASEDLGLPRATVTDAIKALEQRLGVRLLHRTTRLVVPTLEGEAFYGRCLRLIADMDDAEAAFRDAPPRGPLRIEVHGTLGRHLLFPHLPGFLQRYPEIELEVSEGDRYVDLLREGVDAALRVGTLADSDLAARRLAMLREVTVAAPGYLQAKGVPGSIESLLGGHEMVGYRSSATGQLIPLEFQQGGQVLYVPLPVRVRVSGADAFLGAALAGLGIIQAPRYRMDPYIARGQLVELLPDAPPTPSPLSLVYPRNRTPSPRLRVFIDWVAGVFEQTGGAGQRPALPERHAKLSDPRG
ncbi:transcriptional regulator [Stenotrophomonas maltophilia]|jgi:DNA-binding transcriptional LysR family regulator|uniref:LysR family transcriptional regulator n=1 Tax=Stenotrophomonas TaxID=40323 RepID=UPI00066BE40C|nr:MULTISPECIES: LysR family transcriptional regulator [Stenotrophomonas]AWB78627.1 LysR family transcriptional regulator [Stenotrophomonas maltophilia]KOO70738.1 transcriptional regulator [Stenotrophomonas maltophilia]MBH1583658.1 LysR family transcriptional regulator [Stenotrophomonas maltophilia]MCR1820837.1 LysR family transcriptional regulator [Stenotrophomonas muris]MCU1071953.1 LysR family transcriptional regulator [Stenotrophomonas maltophilia]